MHHTVVISDIHLCEVEREDGLWMRYRQEPFSPDHEIAEMLARVRANAHGDELTLVLNGDVFDLDAPRVINQKSVFHDLPRTAANAVPSMRAILDDHPVFVDALARILAESHAIVLVSGNHDVQLTLHEVRGVVRDRLLEATEKLHAEAGRSEPRAAILSRITFRAWFHRTADGIVIEHGNQYDPYCSFRYPMAPFGRDPREIQPTMGSLAARNLIGRMGYFNPHVERSFMLSTLGYFAHWARYYLFSRRSLAFAWVAGAMRTFLELFRVRDPETAARRRANSAAAARETGTSRRQVEGHARLFARPAEDRLGLVARELWIDRALLLFGTVLIGTVWLLITDGPLAAGAALAPALFVGYELLVPKSPLDANWRRVQRAARRVARVQRASAVVFGHTHLPDGVWRRGVFIGNTGSWSAAFRDLECTQPLFDERPVVWLRSGGERGGLEGGLYTWKDGRFAEQSCRKASGPVSQPAARFVAPGGLPQRGSCTP
jgi:UDP-2,3-diacylglucosamine pyrophosphatase LpxH